MEDQLAHVGDGSLVRVYQSNELLRLRLAAAGLERAGQGLIVLPELRQFLRDAVARLLAALHQEAVGVEACQHECEQSNTGIVAGECVPAVFCALHKGGRGEFWSSPPLV